MNVPLVSPEDAWVLERWSWRPDKDGYFRANIKGKKVALHRYILGLSGDLVVDHINDCVWDNRRENLRVCTRQQNTARIRPRRPSATGYRGVVLKPKCKTNPYQAKIMVNYKTIGLGHFPTPEQAAHAYDAAAKRFLGEFARLNFS